MSNSGKPPRALLIAGPTASGKSALALRFAQSIGATIVNADSMQVYRDLRILTARPSHEEERLAPHLLFGEIDGAVNYSVARFDARAREILAVNPGPVVFVGGTGLYFSALIEGLSEIPPVSDEVRTQVRAAAAGRKTSELHAELTRIDPDTAARLRPSDRQRLLRALEVMQATGCSLSKFQNRRAKPALAAGEWRGLFLARERDTLTDRIAQRFAAMLARGALEEVARLADRQLDPALPIMRAHGVPPLLAHLRGEISLEDAAVLGVRDTKAYAKRQVTWARHQLPGFDWKTPEEAAGALALN